MIASMCLVWCIVYNRGEQRMHLTRQAPAAKVQALLLSVVALVYNSMSAVSAASLATVIAYTMP